uniref:Stabilizer of axonemal microtubules 2 n=1 Tax=Monodelphis domestica TaxID=13616 RepID=A0A5F8H3X3_MONDO
MTLQCLCQICTCGLHRCPQKPTKIYEDGDLSYPTTEYLEKYTNFENVIPSQNIKSLQHEHQADGSKMSECLSYDIIKKMASVKEEYKPKKKEIDFASIYKQDFKFYPLQPAKTMKPLERSLRKEGKMDTLPTYKAWSPTLNTYFGTSYMQRTSSSS